MSRGRYPGFLHTGMPGGAGLPTVRRALQCVLLSAGMKVGGRMDIQVGNIVKLKKQHPCGSREWEVLRIGADFRLKCLGCGHQIMVSRKLVEKNVREIREKA